MSETYASQSLFVQQIAAKYGKAASTAISSAERAQRTQQQIATLVVALELMKKANSK